MKRYDQLKQELYTKPRVWLVTGMAGFIGSHLLETLLNLRQRVVGLDNFSTGYRRNLEDVRARVGTAEWENFIEIRGDISNPEDCKKACANVDIILHHAALGSVPWSVDDPIATNRSNVVGFLNLLKGAKDAKVKRFVYASSSAVYGDDAKLPKIEDQIGNCLSPYAVSKRVDELYADVFARCYGMASVGLRYFNVFGPRQDPNGAYAAVIPKWVSAMIQQDTVQINGDGETSRDFCYVKNVVQANILAATVDGADAINQVYNIAAGGRTSLNQLYSMLQTRMTPQFPHLEHAKPKYCDFRPGDVRHSNADITKARRFLGYEPSHDIEAGLDEALNWYVSTST